MAPRKSSEHTAEPRRSSRRIADKPRSSVEDKTAPKSRTKKGSTTKKREANDDAENDRTRQAKKAKGSAEENGEEQDQLVDDDDAVDVPLSKPIDIGDSLPSLTLKNEREEDVNTAELAAEKGLVLFLVPKADTPGCTKQACGFRDAYPDFTKLDFNVYCVSADSVAEQAKWQIKQQLPYSLLSDHKRDLIKMLGAADGNKTKRSHFIFEKGGKLIDKQIPVKPIDSPEQALEFIQALQG